MVSIFDHSDTLLAQLKQSLESLALDQRARESGLVQGTPKKITPLTFVFGLILMSLTQVDFGWDSYTIAFFRLGKPF
jgi:hypothetical protein